MKARVIKATGITKYVVLKANEKVMGSQRVARVLSSDTALAKELKKRRISSEQIREAGAIALRSLSVGS